MLTKQMLPDGTPRNGHGFWSPLTTMPLQPPRADRKANKSFVEVKAPTDSKSSTASQTSSSSGMASSASSTSLNGASARQSLDVSAISRELMKSEGDEPTDDSLAESSSENISSAPVAHWGTITFRVNYESRYQEWMELAWKRGQFFTWGAVCSQAKKDLVLKPQLVKGMDDVLRDDAARNFKVFVTTNGYYSAITTKSQVISFGMSYSMIERGERVCYQGPSLSTSDFTKEHCLVDFACGVTHFLLLDDQGHLFASGLNQRGERGSGFASDTADFTPKRVIGLNHEFIVGVAAGRCHSLAWSQDGKLFSWGDASLVRMWTPDTDWIDGPFDHLAHTDEEEAKREVRDIAPVPKRVQGLEGVKIVKGYTNLSISAVISDTNDLYTWGDHHCAGYDTKNLNVQYPQKIEALAGRVIGAAVGPYFVIALDVDGQLWSWGCMFQKNPNPQVAFPLGRGGARSFQPERIPGLPRIKDISCIGTTVFALDVDGQLWCWGDSQFGECFKAGVSYGRPIKSDFFRDVKVAMLAKGFGTTMGVFTSPD